MTTVNKKAEFVPLCPVSTLHQGEGKHVRPPTGRWRNKAMAVFQENDNYYVMNFICPHSGGPMSAGTIKDGVVECPWHAWRFHADTGLSLEEDGHDIEVYECKVEDGHLLVGGIKRPANRGR
jgi:nitrite reductase/ring-hydroxylating ferredoxin subunit